MEFTYPFYKQPLVDQCKLDGLNHFKTSSIESMQNPLTTIAERNIRTRKLSHCITNEYISYESPKDMHG